MDKLSWGNKDYCVISLNTYKQEKETHSSFKNTEFPSFSYIPSRKEII